jgi:hypothetical protein
MKVFIPALKAIEFTKKGLHLAVLILFGFGVVYDESQAASPNYDIIYIKAPRQGDDTRIEFPEVTHPMVAQMFFCKNEN